MLLVLLALLALLPLLLLPPLELLSLSLLFYRCTYVRPHARMCVFALSGATLLV